MPSGQRGGIEKRGHLAYEAEGERLPRFVVLRRGAVRVFESAKDGHHGALDVTIRLGARCEVRVPPGGGSVEIHEHAPRDHAHIFRPKTEAEVQSWGKALERSLAAAQEGCAGHLQTLRQGSTAYKYNYSNSKRMRRHFWVEEERVELCWGKSRDEEPQTMDLKECVGIIYGPMTTTFQRCTTLEDAPWCCFSLLFPDRTLDLAVPGDFIDAWYLGLQHILLDKSSAAGSLVALSEVQFIFRKVFHKLRSSAHKQGFTTRAMLVRRVRALAQDARRPKAAASPTREIAATNAQAADAEAEAKAERKRRRKEAKAEAEAAAAEPPAAVNGKAKHRVSAPAVMAFAPSERPAQAAPSAAAAAAAAEEEDLQRMIADLERELEAATAKLETLRPSWSTQIDGDLPLDSVSEVLRSDSVSWCAEKCAELESEVLGLKVGSLGAQRQLQAAEKFEKQLKKSAKQLRDSDSQVQSMEGDLALEKVGAQSSETAKFSSSDALERTEAQTTHLDRRVRELEQQLQRAGEAGGDAAVLQEQNQKQAAELARLEQERAELQRKADNLTEACRAAEQRKQENERRLAASEGLSRDLARSLRSLQGDVAGLRDGQQRVRSDCESQLRIIADCFPPLQGAVQKIGASADNVRERYRELAEERKKLHNQVLELKGNIRVFVRVRPMNEKEKGAETSGDPTITFAEDCKISVFDSVQAKRKWFEFDAAFQPKSTQQEVFEEVKPLAASVLDGYNVCIFAYGQTGSGKTFTMTGNEANPGLNTRVLTELFRIRDARRAETEIKISIMITEIYNETIKDLFVTKQKKLDVKTNPDGTSTVPGITELPVECVTDVLQAMKDASSNRTVMATDMNEESSRSHSIVQVKTVSRPKGEKREFIGKINLIDLAGSENVNKSGVQGQGMREAQNINKSLSALGDVIQALVAKGQHVPYRNSKLTMMLKDSLGGDAKTLMIVQSSPAQVNVTETLSSLNFASRARNVELGKAKKNVKGGE